MGLVLFGKMSAVVKEMSKGFFRGNLSPVIDRYDNLKMMYCQPASVQAFQV